MVLFLQKGLFVTSAEKQKATEDKVNTKNIDVFEDVKEFYNSYFINLDKNNSEYFINYNEFIYDSTEDVCLFWDIDIKIEDFYKNIKPKAKLSEFELLASFIKDFIDYIYNYDKNEDKNFCFSYINNRETIPISEIKTNTELINIILKEVYVTKSNNKSKKSFHVFFKNILLTPRNMFNFKNIMGCFKKDSKHPFISYIDLHVYKENSLLRTIYATKTKDDEYYHYPLNINKSNNSFIITENEEDIDEILLENYLFSSNNRIITNKSYFKFNTYINPKSLNLISSLPSISYNMYMEIDNIDIHFLTLYEMIDLSFSNKQKISITHFNYIKNFSYYENHKRYLDLTDNEKNNLILEVDYRRTKCLFCKKIAHKNEHFININKYGLLIIKKGNPGSCIINTIPFRPLSEYKLCKWLFEKTNVIKRIEKDSVVSIIAFFEDVGWEKISENDLSPIRYVLNKYSYYFSLKDIKVIESMTEKKIKEIFKSLIRDIEIINIDKESKKLFKFKNGILEIYTEVFTPMKDSKNLYILDGFSYNYVSENNYNEKQKELDKEFKNILEEILPTYYSNGKINENRIIFETNLSTILCKENKPVITFFKGSTKGGKSTIKHSILSLTENFGIELPITSYVLEKTPNSPNPWEGSIGGKLVSFASEPAKGQKFIGQTTKLMTEHRILARELHKNQIGSINTLTQFVDTNYPIIFDDNNPSVLRRIAIVKFESFFYTKDGGDLVPGIIERKYEQKPNLSERITGGEFNTIFVNIILNWYKKYHSKGIKMKHTSSDNPVFQLNKCINNICVLSNRVNKRHYIKPKKQDKYIFIEEQHRETLPNFTIGARPEYFKKEIIKIVRHFEWDINVSDLIIQLKSDELYPAISFIFIKDINSKYIQNVLTGIDENNQKIREPYPINQEYYNNVLPTLKEIFKKDFSENEEEEEEEEEEVIDNNTN